jgi:Protein of unknown function (DUF3102)
MSGSNITAQINAEHALVEHAKRSGVQHAIEYGRSLQEAKGTSPHGTWEDWLQEHCVFSLRRAQLYMRVYARLAADPTKAQRVAELSLREIDRALAKPGAGQRRYEISPSAR